MKSPLGKTKLAGRPARCPPGDALGSVKLFADLGQTEWNALRQIAATKEYRRGQIIFSEGEASGSFCVLTAGVVKIFRVSADGKEAMLRVAEAGEPFAEEDFFEGNHSASSQALVAGTVIIRLEGNGFKRLLLRSPQLSFKLIEGLASRLARMTDALADHRLKGVPARFTSYVLSLSGHSDGWIAIPMSKTLVAQMLGTSKETLSRVLRRMVNRRVLTCRGNQLRILNRARLEDLAHGDGKI